MEFHLSNEIYTPTSLFALFVFVFCVLVWKRSTSRYTGHRRLPPVAAGSWPLLGHLRLLGKNEPYHRILSKFADKYGPIFMIHIGTNRAVVVSNREIAAECLGTNDVAFANRPRGIAFEHLSQNYAMVALSPFGSYWRELRKIAAVELLSKQRLEMLEHVRVSEVRAAIKIIHDRWTQNKHVSHEVIMDMKKWFADITMNAMVRLVAGKVLRELPDHENNRCHKAVRGWFEFAGMYLIADALPFLRWFDIGGHEKAIKKVAQEVDSITQSWLEEHKKGRVSADLRHVNHDFMDVILQTLNTADPISTSYDADTIIKSTCLAMILGGTDTSSATLGWALSLLLNNPHVLMKAQEELDTLVGKQRQVLVTDMKNLTYLQAIIKETMRLYPAAPLLLPHEASTDCCIGGYHIPAGTRLIVNVHKIQRDPDVWPDPSEFRPERFLTTHRDVDVRGQSYELIPFGSGRRICPGISFALQIMQFTLASLLHGFDFVLHSDELVDMTEAFGQSNLKASPLDVALAPRLVDILYSDDA